MNGQSEYSLINSVMAFITKEEHRVSGTRESFLEKLRCKLRFEELTLNWKKMGKAV